MYSTIVPVLCNSGRIFVSWCAKLWGIMRSSRVVRASDCQCQSLNGPGFDPSILRHSGIWGAADEAVLNKVHEKTIKDRTGTVQYAITMHTSSVRCCPARWFFYPIRLQTVLYSSLNLTSTVPYPDSVADLHWGSGFYLCIKSQFCFSHFSFQITVVFRNAGGTGNSEKKRRECQPGEHLRYLLEILVLSFVFFVYIPC